MNAIDIVSVESHNHYQMAPDIADAANASRRSHNYVAFPWYLKPLEWGDSLSRLMTGRPAYRMKERLLKRFDAVQAPPERWGSAQELAVVRRNLLLLSQSLDANPYISPVGRLLYRAITEEHLKNRANTIAFYEANREFIEANGRFQAPLIVTGFPRTGTTLLQRLLSEDPNTRSPFTYELEKSTPPLRAGQDPMRDTRIEKSAASMALVTRLMPGFREKVAESHLWSPLEKEESMIYMQLHHGMHLVNGIGAGRRYFRSINRPDVADSLFRYERNFFTMLDAYASPRSHWTLKAPSYAPYFSKLFVHYPDARVVVTHRHPAKNFASVCRLLESFNLPFDHDGSFDKLRFGDIVQDVCSVFLSAPLEFREANPQREAQIADCMYQDLIRDPIGVVKNLYRKFGMDYTQAFEDRMRRYLRDNQQGKHGRRRYSNEEYGIDPNLLYESNRAYFDRYGFSPDAMDAD